MPTTYEQLEKENRRLRAQLASAQAEKKELVKQCLDIAKHHATNGLPAWRTDRMMKEILALIPKDNQEVNKHE